MFDLFSIINMILKIIAIVLFLIQINSYKFQRIVECMIQSSKECVKWKSQLFYYSPESSVCFPKNAKVKIQNKGVITMEYLEVGDMILSYDQVSGQLKYKPLSAWLHRSPKGYYPYLKIRSKDPDTKFMISPKHNIAIQHNNELEYIFSQRLQQKNVLKSFLNDQQEFDYISIKPEIIKEQMGQGIYAPFVSETMNFFIVSENQKYLILVHCFANVNINPQSSDHTLPSIQPYLHSFNSMMNTGYYLGFNTQPGDYMFIHPFVSLLSSIFPHVIDWRQEKYEIVRTQNGIKMRHAHDTFREYSIFDEQPSFLRHDKQIIIFLQSILFFQKLH